MIQRYLDFHLEPPFRPWRHERVEATSPVVARAHLAIGLPDYPMARRRFRKPSEAMRLSPVLSRWWRHFFACAHGRPDIRTPLI